MPLIKKFETGKSENKDLLWLQDTLEEKLYRIRILSDQSFRYHCTSESGEKYLYIPLIPNYLINKFTKIDLEIHGIGNISLNLNNEKQGYPISDDQNIPKEGFCRLPESLIQELKNHIHKKKNQIKRTLIRFLNSYKSSTTSWRSNYLKGQKGIPIDMNANGLRLEIIEGEAGTGKSETIIRSLPNYDGRVAIIVFSDGGAMNFRERTNPGEIYFYNNQNCIKFFKDQFLDRIKQSEVEFTLTEQQIQDEWKDLLDKASSINSFLSVFSNAVVIKEKDISFFNYEIGNPIFYKLFVDDANNFHPWNILEVLPMSNDITITGDDKGQLFAEKDFEYLVNKLQFKTLDTSLNRKFDRSKAKTSSMDLNEKLSTKEYMQGDMRVLARTIRSGISFPPKKKW